MRLKQIKYYYNMCSGSTKVARVYFQEHEKLYYWDELSPGEIRVSPSGKAGGEVREKVKSLLKRERARRRFTSEAHLLSKALKSLS